MNQEEKIEKKLQQLKEKREKIKTVLQVQTEQLKKVDEEIQVLEMKKNNRLIKNFQSNLQKEGLEFDQTILDKILGLLRTEKTDVIENTEEVEAEIPSDASKNVLDEKKDAYPNGDIPSVPDAFR